MENNIAEMKLQAEGIVCAGCATDMENILIKTEGVTDASVDYSTGIISIRYDPDAIKEKQIFMAVRRLGFKITTVNDRQSTIC